MFSKNIIKDVILKTSQNSDIEGGKNWNGKAYARDCEKVKWITTNHTKVGVYSKNVV